MALGFVFYDLTFLVLFALFMTLFLYKRRKKVDKEGIFMFLYRTEIGLESIDNFAKKHKKTLKILSYVIVFCGLLLMLLSIYLLIQVVLIFTQPAIVKAIKLPPIIPLIPYLPEIFKITWLPHFYFTYWIIVIALVAIFHEGAHGVLARHNKIKIKSTGFGFFWPLLSLLFFVEQDEKDMEKKKIFPQMTTIAAGVFANLVLALLFFLSIIFFFNLTYVPSGIIFNDYAYSTISSAELANSIILNETIKIDGVTLTKIQFASENYFVFEEILKNQSLWGEETIIKIYHDEPAIRSNLIGAIIKIDDQKISKNEDVSYVLLDKKPGEVIRVITEYKEDKSIISKEYNLTLGKDYLNKTKGVMGIMTVNPRPFGVGTFFPRIYSLFRDNTRYYKAKINAEFADFIYNLFLWLFLINASVGIFNMLPCGIFDGGRFFYLAILGITKKKKIAEKAFKVSSLLIISLLLASMVLWLWGILVR